MTTQINYQFAPAAAAATEPAGERWKVLIIDDEPEVHAVTRLALSDFKFLGRGLEFHSAESGEAGKELVAAHPDAAIVLLDVVMETDDAGLTVARYIREELGNRFTRIILRTGQPGQAPERTVVASYDINDYKSKTELTAQKLFTAVMVSLRSYRDILLVDRRCQSLHRVLELLVEDPASRHPASWLERLEQQLRQLTGRVAHSYTLADAGLTDPPSTALWQDEQDTWLYLPGVDYVVKLSNGDTGLGQHELEILQLISQAVGRVWYSAAAQ